MYRNDLSIRLAALQDLSVPELNGFSISHLLWADDLILFALDAVTLQKEVDCLNAFATKWELRTIDQDWQNQNNGVLLKLSRAELLVWV